VNKLTVVGWTTLISDNNQYRVHLFRDVATGLIVSSTIQHKAADGETWGPATEAKQIA